MTCDYLVGEFSMRLGSLQAASSDATARDVERLRHRVENRPPAELTLAAVRALALADAACWDSLSRGDSAAFTRQAEISAELLRFSICARLIGDD
jgi:hypothetical protein